MSELSQRPSAGRVDVAVIGAGLTGLSAALHLRRAGVRARIFERAEEPGGHAVTVEERGYRFDRTGHLLHVSDSEIRALALGFIGPSHREIDRQSVVWSHGVFTRYPFQANAHGLPPAVAYACLMGFLEAHAQRGTTPPARDFEAYCRRSFGDGISDHFMVPYNARLWGVPPHEISTEWCQRFVPEPSLEDVVAGAVGLRARELGYNARFIYPTGGIGQLARGLARACGEVECGRAPVAIDLERREVVFDDERVGFDVLVNTSPLPPFVEMCHPVPSEVVAAARRLRKTHLYYLDIALRSPCLLPYHWIYVPEAKYAFYRVGCYSHFSPEMAPPGAACLYVELAERAEPDLASLLPRVAAELCDLGLIPRPEAVLFARLRRLEWAYVLYDHAWAPSLATLRPFLSRHRILSVGRYGGWNYSSMADALRFGRDAAAEAIALLGCTGRAMAAAEEPS